MCIRDRWTIIENTQEPIIDQETYDNVQRIRAGVRRYPDGWGEAHPLEMCIRDRLCTEQRKNNTEISGRSCGLCGKPG